MSEQTFKYDQLLHQAMIGLVAKVLSKVAEDGLTGEHFFYISFDTTHPGVDMADHLRARYPDEMTIVLQEWFDGLAVLPDRFTVTLNFGNTPEPLVIPFDALKTFVDPSQEFGLAFDAYEKGDGGPGEPTPVAEAPSAPAPTAQTDAEESSGDVVSLDRFRKP
ncbi:MAG: ClpXP protease specificity-enhancing factor SspB [Pseudomonadota bacterium]